MNIFSHEECVFLLITWSHCSGAIPFEMISLVSFTESTFVLLLDLAILKGLPLAKDASVCATVSGCVFYQYFLSEPQVSLLMMVVYVYFSFPYYSSKWTTENVPFFEEIKRKFGFKMCLSEKFTKNDMECLFRKQNKNSLECQLNISLT